MEGVIEGIPGIARQSYQFLYESQPRCHFAKTLLAPACSTTLPEVMLLNVPAVKQ